MEGLILITVIGFIYFIPSMMAFSRGMKKASGVFVLNLFLGVTLIGWVLALAWASCGDVEAEQ